MKRIFVLTWMVLAMVAEVAAQHDFRIRSYGQTDALKTRGTTCVAQVNGFIWVGTSTGLHGFDGQYTSFYEIPDPDGRGAFYTRVTSILQAEDGTMWVGTRQGIYIFEMERERLKAFTMPGLPKNFCVNYMQFDEKGDLWVLGEKGVYVLNLKERKVSTVGTGIVTPTCLYISKKGTIWMAGDDGNMYRYEPSNRRFFSYSVEPQGMEDFNDIIAITELADGTLALTSGGSGACLFSPDDYSTSPLLNKDDKGLPITGYTAISPDGENLWIGSEHGIIICNTKTRAVSSIRQRFNSNNTLTDNCVRCLYKDAEGGVWVGTYFGGMNRISLAKNNFSSYMPIDGQEVINVVREVCGDNHGHLWVGTEDGGLYLFDREKGILHLADVAYGSAPTPYNVQSLMVVGDDLWAGTLIGGVYIIDTQTLRLKKHYTVTNNTALGGSLGATSLCQQKGTIFVASPYGVYLFNPKEETFEPIPELDGFFISHLYADRHGKVWATTYNNGLWKIEQKNGKWVGQKTRFHYSGTCSVMEDSRGYLWVGTDKCGVSRYDDKSGKTYTLDISERLRKQAVTNIVEDADHRLWFSTFDGLYAYNLERGVMNHFTTANGLPSDFLNYSSGYRDKDGTIYIGTYKGLTSFNPSSFILPRDRLNPYFLYLYVNGVRVRPGDPDGILPHTLYLMKEIKLPYEKNTLTLHYAAPTYRPGTVVWYRYRFNPTEPWVVSDSPAPLQLNNLAPGKYEISLQASFNPDIWEGGTAVLNVEIAPPGYLSPWAIVGYIMGIVIIVGTIMIMFNRVENKNIRLQNQNTAPSAN